MRVLKFYRFNTLFYSREEGYCSIGLHGSGVVGRRKVVVGRHAMDGFGSYFVTLNCNQKNHGINIQNIHERLYDTVVHMQCAFAIT